MSPTPSGGPPERVPERPIGELLVEAGFVTREHIEQALSLQATEGGRLCSNLIRLGHVTSEQLTWFLQNHFGFVPFRLHDIVADAHAPARVPADVARYYKMIPVEEKDGTLRVAFREGAAEDVGRVARALEELTDLKVEALFSPEPLIMEALDNRYGGVRERGVHWHVVGENLFVLQDSGENVQPLALSALGPETSSVEWLRAVLSHAIKAKAREMAFNPGDRGTEISFGAASAKSLPLPMSVEKGVLDFLKKLVKHPSFAGREGAAERPRAALQIGKRYLTLEARFFHTVFGERTLLRFFDEKHLAVPFRALLDAYADAGAWAESFGAEPKGVWILSGPADAHRSSFHYALLERALGKRRHVISIERKVTAHVRGLQQVAAGGRDIGDAVGEALDQRPGAIAVSEIEETRDAERVFLAGARVPVVAVLTSYDSFSALAWFLDRGLRSPLKAGLCRGILALRAFDALCEQCAEHYTLKPSDAKLLAAWGYGDAPFFASAGCEACREDGGAPARVVVPETLDVAAVLPQFLSMNPPSHETWRDAFMRERRPIIARRALDLAASRKLDIRSILRALPVF